jgi:hypothetical protein
VKRTQLAAYIGIVAVAAAGLWRVETTANTAHDAAREARDLAKAEEAEDVEEQRHACETQLQTRGEAEQTLVRVATDLGADADTISIIHRGYDSLPSPPDC